MRPFGPSAVAPVGATTSEEARIVGGMAPVDPLMSPVVLRLRM
jgi:hypothetical protein